MWKIKNILTDDNSILSQKNFVILTLGQFVSQLGSAMTAYALMLWAYAQTGSVMSMSLLAVCSYLPGGIAALYAGGFVDSHDKKRIMLVCDALSACVSCAVLGLLLSGGLRIAYLYPLNALLGLLGAFQSPASSVAVTRMLPEKHYARAGALQSMTGAVSGILTPALAATIMFFGGTAAVVIVDLCTFTFAFVTLLRLHIPDAPARSGASGGLRALRSSVKGGVEFLRGNAGIRQLIIFMGIANLFSAVSYYNLLPAMIIRRSGTEWAYGVVSSMMGIGSLLGGMLAGALSGNRRRAFLLCLCTGLSFLLGDLSMGMGRTLPVWIMAALLSNIPIPVLDSNLSTLFRLNVPVEMQGRVFALRSAVNQIGMPVGYLIGGLLGDCVVEPMMLETWAQTVFGPLVGVGAGSGMAVVFLFTGTVGAVLSLCFWKFGQIRNLRQEIDK